MGLFKDAKDAIKGAKELGDYHGGMPSTKGSFQDIKAVTDDRGQNEILKNGTPAKAVALGFATASPTEKFAMQIELEIHPTDGEPVQGHLRVSVGAAEGGAVGGYGSAGEDQHGRPDAGRGAVGRAQGIDRGVGRRDERGDAGAAEHLRGHCRRGRPRLPRGSRSRSGGGDAAPAPAPAPRPPMPTTRPSG